MARYDPVAYKRPADVRKTLRGLLHFMKGSRWRLLIAALAALANGIIGVLEGGLLSTSRGLFYGHGIQSFLVQLLGIASIGTFVLITTFVMFYILKKTMGIRVTKEEELDGLDKHEHGMVAYIN